MGQQENYKPLYPSDEITIIGECVITPTNDPGIFNVQTGSPNGLGIAFRKLQSQLPGQQLQVIPIRFKWYRTEGMPNEMLAATDFQVMATDVFPLQESQVYEVGERIERTKGERDEAREFGTSFHTYKALLKNGITSKEELTTLLEQENGMERLLSFKGISQKDASRLASLIGQEYKPKRALLQRFAEPESLSLVRLDNWQSKFAAEEIVNDDLLTLCEKLVVKSHLLTAIGRFLDKISTTKPNGYGVGSLIRYILGRDNNLGRNNDYYKDQWYREDRKSLTLTLFTSYSLSEASSLVGGGARALVIKHFLAEFGLKFRDE